MDAKKTKAAAELRRRGYKSREIAETLGVSDGLVRHWMCGSRYPGGRLMSKMSLIYGIPAHWWYEPAEDAA